MRIIAGERKGMRLEAPPGRDVRPSSDMLRGAVMSILGGRFHGERLLDVCAGTGAMSLEFLSRGGAGAVAIERDPVALDVLRRNAHHTRLADRLDVQVGDAVAVLDRLGQRGEQFAFAYVDPPYDAGLYPPILQALARHRLIESGGRLLVESRRGLEDAWMVTGFRLVDRRRYGSTTLDLLQPCDTPADEQADGTP